MWIGLVVIVACLIGLAQPLAVSPWGLLRTIREPPIGGRIISPSYSHTQEFPLCLILFGSSIPFFIVAWFAREQPVVIAVMIGPGLLLALLGLAFHHLTVEDEGDRLAIRFGPLPFLETSIRYAHIQRVEVGRTMILDGWGIHRSPRHGWVWNLWDRDCVVIHRQCGVLRVGSDDVENLAGFLKGKMGAA